MAKRTKALDPFMVMGENLYRVWRDSYCPWYAKAWQRSVEAKIAPGYIHHPTIVFNIIVNDLQTSQIDRVFQLKPGTAIKTLRNELDEFNQYRRE